MARGKTSAETRSPGASVTRVVTNCAWITCARRGGSARTEIDGEPGLLFMENGAVRYAPSPSHVERERIQGIFVVANPGKLGER